MEYSGSTAVVTGAASGIGRALAIELAKRGANLAISDVNGTGLAETVERCEDSGGGGKTRSFRLDVSDRAAVLAHADDVVAEFGKVNLVINNAGVAVAAPVLDMSWEDMDWLMGINFWGVVHGTKAFLPHLIASGDGHLVNISSIFGMIGVPTQSAYNAAKFGVRGFTEALRQEMIIDRHPVAVSCVHPGGIRTNIARSGRLQVVEGSDREKMNKDFDRVARTTPEKAALTILKGVDRKKARVLIGGDAYMIDAMARALGAKYEGLMARGARLGRRRIGI